MFNIGAGEMILIALVLLIAVGPEQLPGVIRRAGRTMGQLRSMSDGLRRDFMSSMDELERASDPRRWSEQGRDQTNRSSDPPAKTPSSEQPDSSDAKSSESAPDGQAAAVESGPTNTARSTLWDADGSSDASSDEPTDAGQGTAKKPALNSPFEIGKIAVAPPFSSSADLLAAQASNDVDADPADPEAAGGDAGVEPVGDDSPLTTGSDYSNLADDVNDRPGPNNPTGADDAADRGSDGGNTAEKGVAS